MVRVLLVEDDEQFGAKCCQWMFEHDFDVIFCRNAVQAREALSNEPFDVAVIDLMLPPRFGTEGLDLLRFIRTAFKAIEPAMMTHKEQGTVEPVAEAMRQGANHFLDKTSPLFYDSLGVLMKEILLKMKNHIFISHGHNELLKLKLKDFLQSRLGQTPIVLAEQPNRGLTVVEKLERVSQKCCFAIVLMTSDDQQKDGGVRARQNVIHEIGFFQGKYGRNNVVLLAERGVEVFTNISGIVRIDFDAEHFSEIFEPLRIEIEAAMPEAPQAFRGRDAAT